MANYYIKDGQFYEIPDDVLMHWKYIKREKVNGKWRYYYDANAGKTQTPGVNKFSNITTAKGTMNKKTATTSDTGKTSKAIDKAKRWLEGLKKNGVNAVSKAVDKVGDAIGFDDKKAYDKARADMARARVRSQDKNLTGGERAAAAKQYERARNKSMSTYKNYMDTPLSLLTNPKEKLSKLNDKISDVGDEISKLGNKMSKRVDAAKNKSTAAKAKADLIDNVKNYEKLTEKHTEYEKEVNKAKSALEKAERTHKGRAKDFDRARMINLGIESAKSEYDKAKADLNKAREQYNKAREQYDGNDAEIKALRKKLDNISVNYRNTYDDYDDVMDQISVELRRQTKWKPTTIPTGITSSSRRR